MHVVRAAMIATACALAMASPATRVAASDTVQRAEVPRIGERPRAWRPGVRGGGDTAARAWSAHGGPRCRNLSLLWRRDAPDGALRIVHESACRDDLAAFAPLALVDCRVLVAGLDAARSVVWWTQIRDPRQMRPMLAPPTGDPAADRESQRIHSQWSTAPSAIFELAISGDSRIRRLELHEPAGCDPGHAMRAIGGVDLPAPGAPIAARPR